MTVAGDSLDRLVEVGLISGYTREESVGYLSASRPTLTYSMYLDDAPSLANRRRFSGEMAALGGQVRETRQVGQLGTHRGVQRTRQVRVIVEFEEEAALTEALGIIRDRYLAGSRGEVPGSWVYPDVRITGTATRRTGTINAHAHVTSQGDESFVVLSSDSCPPLPGMSVTSLHLLDCWESLPGFMEREAAG